MDGRVRCSNSSLVVPWPSKRVLTASCCVLDTAVVAWLVVGHVDVFRQETFLKDASDSCVWFGASLVCSHASTAAVCYSYHFVAFSGLCVAKDSAIYSRIWCLVCAPSLHLEEGTVLVCGFSHCCKHACRNCMSARVYCMCLSGCSASGTLSDHPRHHTALLFMLLGQQALAVCRPAAKAQV
jgi:hypothetical protein